MPNDNLEQLQKLTKLINTDRIITPEEIEQVITTLVTILANNKKVVEEQRDETKAEVQKLVEQILAEREAIVSGIRDDSDQKIGTLIQRVNDTLSRVKDGIDGLPGKDADPAAVVPLVLEQIKLPEVKQFMLTGEEIVDKVNALPTDDDDLKVDASHIKGLKEFVNKESIRPINPGIGSAREFFKDIDLSDQLDGVTKTFNLPAVWNIISVSLTSYPYGSLRKGIDFTFTPTSITFGDSIDAETQLSSGQQCILTVVVG